MSLGAARVIYTINDLSVITDAISKGYVIVLVNTERGPLWTPTPVTFWDEFSRTFGGLISSTLDPLTLQSGLMQGAKFLVIRCVHCTDPSDPETMTADYSTLTLQDRGDVPTPAIVETAVGPFTITAVSPGTVLGAASGPFTFSASNNKMLLNTDGGSDVTITLTGTAQTVQQVVDQINAAITDCATEEAGCVRLTAETSDDALDVKTIANSAYSTLGLSVATHDPEGGTDSLVIAIHGQADQTFQLTTGRRTAVQVATDLSGLIGATITTRSGLLRLTTEEYGASASIQIKSTSTATEALGFDNDAHTGTEGTAQDTITIRAKNPGTWGDNLCVMVLSSALNPDTHFDMKIVYYGNSVLNEYFGDLTMDDTDPKYAVNVLNNQSRLVEADDEASTNINYSNRPATTSTLGVYLSGGADGLVGFNDADWLGDPLAQTGMYAINKTEMSMDVMIPSSSSVTVLQSLAAFCENTGKHVAYGAVPYGLDPLAAKDWRMGEGAYAHEPFNSHRLSLWFGRPLYYNSSTDSREYIPNLGMLASCITKNDMYYDTAHAFVGPRRGTVDLVEGLDFNMNDYPGYQDMYADYCLNYLQITRTEGAVFWEQRNTQLVKSSTQNINVVRFLTQMRLVLEPVLRTFIMEENTPLTWREVKRELEPQFRLWKAQSQIYDYCLQCDEDAFFDGGELKNAVLNSGLEIDQGIYRARALIQPTQAILYLEFEVGVTNTGAAFATFTQLKTLPGWVRR